MNGTELSAHFYLLGISATTERINALREAVEYHRGLMQTKDLAADRVQTSGIGNPTEQRALRVLALLEELEDMEAEELSYNVEAFRIIRLAGLTKDEFAVIRQRYFPDKSGRTPAWRDIARITGYSEKHVYKVRRRALVKIAETLKREGLNDT